MKQNVKRLLLALCLSVSFFVLSGCSAGEDSGSQEITEDVRETLLNGAWQYLTVFESYSDEELEKQIKKAEKSENTVIASALSSWKSVKDDLGSLQADEMGIPQVRANEETNEDEISVRLAEEDLYEIEMTVIYEKRDMDFVLTAESQDDGYGGSVLTVTEMSFTPEFTTAEKLEKAFLNMLMGMGTVFAVLIFISFIIGRLKVVNDWEKKRKEKASAPAPTASAPTPAVPVPAAPAPAPAPAVPAQPENLPQASETEKVQENLADDLELVAVITAAISASQNIPAEGLVVRSIRRKSNSKWKRS